MLFAMALRAATGEIHGPAPGFLQIGSVSGAESQQRNSNDRNVTG